MIEPICASAHRIRTALMQGLPVQSSEFREELTKVPPRDRDAWIDLVLGIDSVPDDGPELPRGCVPYFPCEVDVLLRMVGDAAVHSSDVFVDVGSGVGRACALVHLLTGASTVGLEIQAELVRAAHALTTRLPGIKFSPVVGDALDLLASSIHGTVYFFYCPFSGDRLESALNILKSVARVRAIRVCCVGLPLPIVSWLKRIAPPYGDLEIYGSVSLD